jgi:hypothetical protein
MLETLPRYVACSRVTKRPIFEFVSPAIHPNEALVAFTFADDYSFGILQSGIHWAWFKARCSTFKADYRYTSDTVFDTFPWPQFDASRQERQGRKGRIEKPLRPSRPSREPIELVRAVSEAARALRNLRHEVMDANDWSLRELYKSLETPDENRLRNAHAVLDAAVRAAYGMKPDEDILAFLLKLNLELADKETKGETITPPGLPAWVPEPQSFVSRDCVRSPDDPEAGGSTAESDAAAAHFHLMGKEAGPPYRVK